MQRTKGFFVAASLSLSVWLLKPLGSFSRLGRDFSSFFIVNTSGRLLCKVFRNGDKEWWGLGVWWGKPVLAGRTSLGSGSTV